MLADRGIRVPDDVAVVGFDDSEEGRYRTPSLTTVSPNKHEIAVGAVEQLLRRLNGDTGSPVAYQAEFRLEARESTLGPGAGRPNFFAGRPLGSELWAEESRPADR